MCIIVHMLGEKVPMAALIRKSKSYGEKFQGLVHDLEKVFTHQRSVEFRAKFPQYLMFEKVLFLAVIERKSAKYYALSKDQAAQQFKAPFVKHRAYLADALKTDVTKFESRADQYLTQLSLLRDTTELFDEYCCQLMLAITGKKQEKGLFGKVKPNVYTQEDIERVGEAFGEKINLFDYSKHGRNLSKSFQNPHEDEIYILWAKEDYFMLYAKDRRNLNAIEVVENTQLKKEEVERIFSKSNIEPNPRNSMSSSQYQSQILFPTEISCASCSKKCPEFDCLFWNYEYFCAECIVDVGVDTSHIPGPRITKYCQERNLNYKKFEKGCPECTGITVIHNYNPASKPRRFTCNVCHKMICLEHNCGIFECFCYCSNCSVPTLFVPSMKINFCQSCRVRKCFNCRTQGKKFCNCICDRCLKENSPNHECEPSCHYCLNSLPKLKNCQCGLFICHGCFYLCLKDDGKYECLIVDYQ